MYPVLLFISLLINIVYSQQNSQISPKGGDVLKVNVPTIIRWTPASPNAIYIQLSYDNDIIATNITSSTSNDGSYTWTPVDLLIHSSCFFVPCNVQDFSKSYCSYTFNGRFSIVGDTSSVLSSTISSSIVSSSIVSSSLIVSSAVSSSSSIISIQPQVTSSTTLKSTIAADGFSELSAPVASLTQSQTSAIPFPTNLDSSSKSSSSVTIIQSQVMSSTTSQSTTSLALSSGTSSPIASTNQSETSSVPSSTNTDSSSKNTDIPFPKSAQITIEIVIPVLALAVAVLAFLLIRRRRRVGAVLSPEDRFEPVRGEKHKFGGEDLMELHGKSHPAQLDSRNILELHGNHRQDIHELGNERER